MAGDSAEPRKPVLLSEPREGVPGVVDTAAGFDSALAELKSADGPVAADAERASGYRYSHEDYLIQIKRVGTGIFLFDVPACSAAGSAGTRTPKKAKILRFFGLGTVEKPTILC